MAEELTVRAIDYEVVPPDTVAATLGLSPDAIQDHLGTLGRVTVLRCVDRYGQKLTALGDAAHFQDLLASGEASDPAGMKLKRRQFPVLIRGWRRAY